MVGVGSGTLNQTLAGLNAAGGPHLVSEPLRLLLIRRQLFLPLLHVSVSLVQSGHQFGVAVLQGEELGLQIHLTDGAERQSRSVVLRGYPSFEDQSVCVCVFTPLRASF